MILLKKCRSIVIKIYYTCKSMYAVVFVSYTCADHFGAICTCKHSLIFCDWHHPPKLVGLLFLLLIHWQPN